MVAFLPSFAVAGEVDREAMRPAALATYARPETKPHPSAHAALNRPAAQAAQPTLAPAPAGLAQSSPTAIGVAVWRPGRARPHDARVLADSAEREAWLRARVGGITATDAAKLATPNSVRQVVRDKLDPSGFSGNAFTEHGRQREPHIASWVLERHGIPACGLLYHAQRSLRHLATPDGLYADDERLLLAEIKTTGKPWKRIPRSYLRQVWWQQYVLGAERTLFVWEQHADFIVTEPEPRCVWIERDETEIERLVTLADLALAELDRCAVEF
ncbi:YqaJ viral recombinase family protein [Pseudoclavibacter endophyticus]|nr:YqaJ viral recombinase family protein [Pseudoclavibacter endophyticus]